MKIRDIPQAILNTEISSVWTVICLFAKWAMVITILLSAIAYGISDKF